MHVLFKTILEHKFVLLQPTPSGTALRESVNADDVNTPVSTAETDIPATMVEQSQDPFPQVGYGINTRLRPSRIISSANVSSTGHCQIPQ